MVNSFIADSSEKGISCTTLSISKGDTIVFKFDQDIFDMQEVSGIIETYQQVFPNNNIVVTFNGIDIVNIIKEERD